MNEEEYDPLLSVAEQGYTPDTYILDLIRQAPNDNIMSSIRVVHDISKITPEEGMLIYDTSDNQMYYGASNTWNVIN